MKVYGIEVTVEQEAAALSAMAGQFRMADIVGALRRSGLDKSPALERAADRLLQRERKAGRIRAVTNKLWEAA